MQQHNRSGKLLFPFRGLDTLVRKNPIRVSVFWDAASTLSGTSSHTLHDIKCLGEEESLSLRHTLILGTFSGGVERLLCFLRAHIADVYFTIIMNTVQLLSCFELCPWRCYKIQQIKKYSYYWKKLPHCSSLLMWLHLMLVPVE